jgi:hypothetical protein
MRFLLKYLLAGGLVLGLGIGLGLPALQAWMMSVPATAFDDTPIPAAPDYKQASNWAALPTRADSADWLPRDSDYQDAQANASADVFFVHPTAAFYGDYWVAALDNRLARLSVDYGIQPQHVTAFNGVGKIYAPRYRSVRMAIWTAEDRQSVAQATDLAYTDVKAAFQHYMREWNQGRPLILVSHSQGTLHMLRLLQEEFDGKPLGKQLIVAYIIGNTVPIDAFSDQLPICSEPGQFGCYATWNTVLEGGNPHHWVQEAGLDQIACVNPLSWRTDGVAVSRESNPGSIPMIGMRALWHDVGPLHAQQVDARCGPEGILWITSRPPASGFTAALFENGQHYHTYDINLFYASIRQNVALQTRNFLSQGDAVGVQKLN